MGLCGVGVWLPLLTRIIDPAMPELFANFSKITQLAKADDPTLRLCGIMLINNMARSGKSPSLSSATHFRK
jgi:hypothetical protein